MAAIKENTLQTDIEQAILNSFVPTQQMNWSPQSNASTVKFSTLLRDAIVKYATQPAFVFQGPLPSGSSNFGYVNNIIIPHGLAYFPNINPIEVYNVLTQRFETTVALTSPVVLDVVDSTKIILTGTVGQVVRITLW